MYQGSEECIKGVKGVSRDKGCTKGVKYVSRE